MSGKANAADVYTKSQTDTLLNAKADVSDLPDMTDYYTKTATDALLDDKADADTTTAALATKADKSDTYTKSQVDTALALKANAADVYTKAETDAKIEEAIEEILPVDTAGPSAIANFTTGLALPLVNCSVGITATGGNGTPDNPNPINGYTEVNITANGDTVTVDFGQTVYGGVLDVTRGKLHATHVKTILDENVVITQGAYGLNFKCNLLVGAKASVESALSGTLSDKLSEVKQTDAWGIDYTFSRIQNSPAQIYFNLNSSITTIEDCITFLESNPIEFVYELATPFDIDLTPEVISAVVGTNNVYSDTNGDTTVKFKDTIQNYIDKKVTT